MKIITPKQRKTNVKYSLNFTLRKDPYSGFGFDCDECGRLLPMTEEAAKNYQKCINGEYDVIPKGIIKEQWSYIEPAIGKCICGKNVELENFTNTCECGRDYSFDGSLLESREQWGEETGESWFDCY